MTIKRNTVLTVLAAMIVTLGLIIAMMYPTNVANATSGDEPCVPSPETSQVVVVTPEQVIQHPAVTHEESVRVGWIRYSWTGGPHEPDTAPAVVPPHPDWQENTHSDPHGVGVEGPYFRSNGNSGKGDWFYLQGVYETVTVTDEEAWTEVIPAVTQTVVTPAVVCPEVETPVANPEPTKDPEPTKNSEPDKDKDEPVRNTPPKDVQVIECVDGVFVTTVNGEVISESGSCVERDENETPVTFSETGL